MKLVVTHAFGEYAVGDPITDPDAMKGALRDHPEKVVKVATADVAPPAPQPVAPVTENKG